MYGYVVDVVGSDVKTSEHVGGDRAPYGQAEIVEMRSACCERVSNGGCREDRDR